MRSVYRNIGVNEHNIGVETTTSDGFTRAFDRSLMQSASGVQNTDSDSETGPGESGELDVDEEARKQDAYLTDSALYILFKIPRRRPGLKLLEFDKTPSVVDLAPAVWNAHYSQVQLPVLVLEHCRKPLTVITRP